VLMHRSIETRDPISARPPPFSSKVACTRRLRLRVVRIATKGGRPSILGHLSFKYLCMSKTATADAVEWITATVAVIFVMIVIVVSRWFWR
jgi:hypothetical protein